MFQGAIFYIISGLVSELCYFTRNKIGFRIKDQANSNYSLSKKENMRHDACLKNDFLNTKK